MLFTIIGGPPAPVTNLDVSELCVNGFIVSWDPFTSHPVCGSVSYNVTISPSDEIMMMEINDTSYSVAKSFFTFTRLMNSANLNVTVIGTNLVGSGVPITTEVKVPGLSQAVPSSKWCVYNFIRLLSSIYFSSYTIQYYTRGEILCYQITKCPLVMMNVKNGQYFELLLLFHTMSDKCKAASSYYSHY